jgi:hypothetical protein
LQLSWPLIAAAEAPRQGNDPSFIGNRDFCLSLTHFSVRRPKSVSERRRADNLRLSRTVWEG